MSQSKLLYFCASSFMLKLPGGVLQFTNISSSLCFLIGLLVCLLSALASCFYDVIFSHRDVIVLCILRNLKFHRKLTSCKKLGCTGFWELSLRIALICDTAIASLLPPEFVLETMTSRSCWMAGLMVAEVTVMEGVVVASGSCGLRTNSNVWVGEIL